MIDEAKKYRLEVAARRAMEIEAASDHDAALIVAELCAKFFSEMPGDTYVAVVDPTGSRWISTLSYFRN